MLKKGVNKFYVGATHIADAIMSGFNDSHTHATLEAAVKAAKEQCETKGCDYAIVVQIVRVVRRKEPVKPPFIVETVK